MEILKILSENEIPFQHFTHPAVFTCEMASQHLQHLPGTGTKNLFLRNEKETKFFLVSVQESKRVDLKALSDLLDTGRLGFASAEHLREYLGVEAGSVTLLAVANDHQRKVAICIDKDLWQHEELQCHPLVNTETVVISPQGLEEFFALLGRSFTILEVPAV